MRGKINCKYNDRGGWCTNNNIKRSLFGIGARCCVEYGTWDQCQYKEELKRPPPPPAQYAIEDNEPKIEPLWIKEGEMPPVDPEEESEFIPF